MGFSGQHGETIRATHPSEKRPEYPLMVLMPKILATSAELLTCLGMWGTHFSSLSLVFFICKIEVGLDDL